MAANDEIWRPDYDGPPPVAQGIAFGVTASTPDSPGSETVRRAGLMGAAVTVVSAVAIASVIVIASLGDDAGPRGAVAMFPPIGVVDDDRLQFGSTDGIAVGDGGPLRLLENPEMPFPGADSRRLPATVTPRWTVDLPPQAADGGETASTWVEAVDDRYVVVGTGDGRRPQGPASVRALDAATGERVWSKELDTRVSNIDVVSMHDDVLVLTVGSAVLALDLGTGVELWNSRLAKVDGALQRIERLEGTDLLARRSPDAGVPISLVDPATGTVVGELPGEVLGTDGQGRWRVLRGDKVLEFDLAERPVGGSAPPVDGELIGTVDAGQSRFVAVVGDALVATVDGMLAAGLLRDADGGRAVGPGGLTPLSADLVTATNLPETREVVALGNSAFATLGGGIVGGAEVVDGSIRVAWQRRGTVTAAFPTERGVLLVVGTDSGAGQTLVDGATGRTVAPLTMAPGLFDLLDVAGNGIVTRRTSPDGPRMAALDLDGEEMWALDGSAPLSVGDGIVARSIPQADGSYEVTVYEEPA